jgi:dTMP kinase
MPSPAKFITLEGAEGVGKSTALKYIEQQLSARKIAYTLTREPGGTPIAEDIRQVLLTKHDEALCPDTELLLMFAGRVQNIQHRILPALARGEWVISDRFTDASFAYQGGGRGLAEEKIARLADWVQGELKPDLTLLLDAPVDIGMKRISGRNEKDRIEEENIEFFKRVRETYLHLAERHPERYRVINAQQPLPEVQQQILQALSGLF